MLVAMVIYHLQSTKKVKKKSIRSRKDHHEIVSFLNHFAEDLSADEKLENASSLVAKLIANAIHAQSLCFFYLKDNENLLVPGAISGVFPLLKQPLEFKNSQSKTIYEVLHVKDGIIGDAVKKKKSLLIKSAKSDSRTDIFQENSQIESLMLVPMIIDNNIEGVICAVNSRDKDKNFEIADLFLLESLAGQAVLARNLIDLYDRLGEKQRIDHELQLTRNIQLSLIPVTEPNLDSFNVSADHLPAEEVSGDFYDFIEINKEKTLVVAADASGKGLPACMIITMARSILRSIAMRFVNLEELLLELNDNLFKNTEASRFVTMGLCLIDIKNNTVECARAGHTEFLYKNPRGECRMLAPEGPAIGLLPNDLGLVFETFSFVFDSGCSLLIYTDGVTEALNIDNEEFGLEKLLEIWESDHGTPEQTIKSILEKVKEFSTEMPQTDDQTLLIVNRQ